MGKQNLLRNLIQVFNETVTQNKNITTVVKEIMGKHTTKNPVLNVTTKATKDGKILGIKIQDEEKVLINGAVSEIKSSNGIINKYHFNSNEAVNGLTNPVTTYQGYQTPALTLNAVERPFSKTTTTIKPDGNWTKVEKSVNRYNDPTYNFWARESTTTGKMKI